jgi:hypothetical protein
MGLVAIKDQRDGVALVGCERCDINEYQKLARPISLPFTLLLSVASSDNRPLGKPEVWELE